MAALLRRIYQQSDWKADPDKTAQRAAYYRSLLRSPLAAMQLAPTQLAPTQEVTVWLEMGKELLRTEKVKTHCKRLKIWRKAVRTAASSCRTT